MRKRFKSFVQDRDRNDPEKIEELFRFLWPDEPIRAECARRLALSIQFAHKQADKSWEVTAFNNNITFNVGQVCVLLLASDEIWVYFNGARNKSVYRAVPGADKRVESPAKISTIPQHIWTAHEALVRTAGEAKKVSPFKKSFSEGVLRYLEGLLGDQLPRPAYLTFRLADEVDRELYEGAVQQVFVNKYERNRHARDACISHYGSCCEVCKCDFEQVYGSFAKGYIHVHHIVPISQIGARYQIDPIRDLRPVCPNCHAMLHTQEPALSISKLRGHIRKSKSGNQRE